MGFYYPLTLGVRWRKPPRPEKEDPAARQGPPARPDYETWREGLQQLEYTYEEHPEGRVLDTLRQTAQPSRKGPRGFWLVLGEPGAGKSTLLEAWFTRWATQLAAPRLALPVPVFVRLRALQPADVAKDSEALARHLWRVGAESRALLESGVEDIYRPAGGERFWPVWLLDGLDELPPPLLSEAFYQKLVNLPGPKVLTCRTAVYGPLAQVANRYKEREYELLGLKPSEQRAFLSEALQGENTKAEALHDNIHRNAQLRWLASNPLMLSLTGEVSTRIKLPKTRAEFYREAVADMWDRRLRDRPEVLYLTSQRDAVLVELAEKMGLEPSASMSWLEQSVRNAEPIHFIALIEGLKQAGVLLVDTRRGTFGFLHLTFQEFYLAQALRRRGLHKVLKQHWGDPRYEESLGLLISLLFQDRELEAIDVGIQWLVELSEATYRKDLRVLWRRQRSPLRVALLLLSPLRVALHLLTRAGLVSESPSMDFLWKRISRSKLRKVAVAADAKTPEPFLARLAEDKDQDVRRDVAGTRPAWWWRWASACGSPPTSRHSW